MRLVDRLVAELEQHEVEAVTSVTVPSQSRTSCSSSAIRCSSAPIPAISSETTLARPRHRRALERRAGEDVAGIEVGRRTRRECRRAAAQSNPRLVGGTLVGRHDDGSEPEREVAVLRRPQSGRPPLGKDREPADRPPAPITAATLGETARAAVVTPCHVRLISAPGPTTAAGLANANEPSSSKTRIEGGCSTGASSDDVVRAGTPRARAPSRRR